jgi:aspartate aminotransferase
MKLSQSIARINPSPTLTITARAKQLKADGKDVVSFGAGEPDFDTPAFIKDAAIKAIQEGFTKYTPSTGIPQLKEAICQKLKRENGLTYSPQQIAVGCGAKHVLYNIFQVLLDPGDEVIVPAPYWVSYPEMVKLGGGTPVIVATDPRHDFKMTPELLQAKLSDATKACILNSPSNPAGVVYTKDELRALTAVLKERSVYIVSDEIYEKIIYGEPHVSVPSLGKDIYDLTVLVNGVSKTFSMTGWRIGYLAAAEDLAQAVKKLQDQSTSNPSSISQKAALQALTDRKAASHIEHMVKEFRKRRDYMVERLTAIKGLSPFVPHGAFYVFCSIEGTGLGSLELAKVLLEEKLVAVIPGAGFGFDTYIRLSFATSMKEIKKGLDRIEEWASASARQ